MPRSRKLYGIDAKRRYDAAISNGTTDYERYLKTSSLFECQKEAIAQCNDDELQFQIVNQVEELWMKLLGHSLINVASALRERAIDSARQHIERALTVQTNINNSLDILYTMSPSSFGQIKLRLANGRFGQSPNLRELDRAASDLYAAYHLCFLEDLSLTPFSVYRSSSKFEDAYEFAEYLGELDTNMFRFREIHGELSQHMSGGESGNDPLAESRTEIAPRRMDGFLES